MVRPTRLPQPVGVGEAIPVDARRLEAADEHAASPVGGRGDRSGGGGDDVREGLVFGDLDGQARSGAAVGRVAGPQQNAVAVRICRMQRPPGRDRGVSCQGSVGFPSLRIAPRPGPRR